MLDDNLCAAEVQLPENSWLLEAASDREQSSKSVQFILQWKCKTLTWRYVAVEEPKHEFQTLFVMLVLSSHPLYQTSRLLN